VTLPTITDTPMFLLFMITRHRLISTSTAPTTKKTKNKKQNKTTTTKKQQQQQQWCEHQDIWRQEVEAARATTLTEERHQLWHVTQLHHVPSQGRVKGQVE